MRERQTVLTECKEDVTSNRKQEEEGGERGKKERNQTRDSNGYLAMSPRYRDLYSQLAGSGFLSVLKTSVRVETSSSQMEGCPGAAAAATLLPWLSDKEKGRETLKLLQKHLSSSEVCKPYLSHPPWHQTNLGTQNHKQWKEEAFTMGRVSKWSKTCNHEIILYLKDTVIPFNYFISARTAYTVLATQRVKAGRALTQGNLEKCYFKTKNTKRKRDPAWWSHEINPEK